MPGVSIPLSVFFLEAISPQVAPPLSLFFLFLPFPFFSFSFLALFIAKMQLKVGNLDSAVSCPTVAGGLYHGRKVRKNTFTHFEVSKRIPRQHL